MYKVLCEGCNGNILLDVARKTWCIIWTLILSLVWYTYVQDVLYLYLHVRVVL